MIERAYKVSDRKKQYRAVVIDGHVIFKAFAVIIAVAALSAVMALNIKPRIINENDGADPDKADVETAAAEKNFDFPAALKNAAELLCGFDILDGRAALAEEVPGAETVNTYGLINMAENGLDTEAETKPESESEFESEPEPEPEPDDLSQGEGDLEIKPINAGQNASSDTNYVKIGNQTSYGVDVEQLLAEPLSLNMAADGPKVLIVHTHATEAYSPEGARRYNSGDSERSLDTAENVVAVGDEVCELLNERGIETLHDRGLHDYPSFNGAYADALNSIEQYLGDYPSIQIVLDLHRDSIVYDDGTKAKLITKIEGREAAQLMFVVGTDEKGLYNPDWRENLKFAVKLQDAIDQKYPNLMRHIDLRQERFNCHATHGSLIIEMGSSGNSLSEAKYAMRCAAEVIADYLNGLM